jgi:hypothetical protein
VKLRSAGAGKVAGFNGVSNSKTRKQQECRLPRAHLLIDGGSSGIGILPMSDGLTQTHGHPDATENQEMRLRECLLSFRTPS